jgi:hypothetical protein
MLLYPVKPVVFLTHDDISGVTVWADAKCITANRMAMLVKIFFIISFLFLN